MNREDIIRKQIFNISRAGSSSIIPQRVEEWISFCCNCYKNNKLYIVYDTVFSMKLLDEGNLNYIEIENTIDYGQYTGQDWEEVEKALAKFHPQGVEFVRANNPKISGTAFEKYLNQVDLENKELLKDNNKKRK